MKDFQANDPAVKEFVSYLIGWGNMRNRKLSREYESYMIAKRSRGGWLTEKLYNEEKIFEQKAGVNKEDKKWWNMEELSATEKLKKLRGAERDASFIKKSSTNKLLFKKSGLTRFSDNNNFKFNRPPPASTATSTSPAVDGLPRKFKTEPFDLSNKSCYICGETGHISYTCPKKK